MQSWLWGIFEDLFLLQMGPIQRRILNASQRSTTELFVKLVKGSQQLTIFAKSSILDVWVGSECVFAVVSHEHKYQYGMENFQ